MRPVADSEDDEREVLTSLPRSRPTRRSSKRGERTATVSEDGSADQAPENASDGPAATAGEAPAKPQASKAPAAKPGASDAPAKRRASKAPAPAAASPRPKRAASSARPKPATASARPKRQPRQPAPAEPAGDQQPPPAETTARRRTPPERKVPPAGYAAPAGGDHEGPSGPTEVLSSAIQAVTELAQIGFSVGRQVLQAAIERLPKP